jgi:hypothetical protein
MNSSSTFLLSLANKLTLVGLSFTEKRSPAELRLKAALADLMKTR